MAAAALPSGTVTFLFTDIEGSTRAWDTDPDQMREWLAAHDDILRQSIDGHDGVVFKHTGDGVCAAFAFAADAVAAALDARDQLRGHAHSDMFPRVRLALHSGAARPEHGDYFGPPLNRCARLLSVTHGGQIVCSNATADLAREALPPTAQLNDLGEHRLRDLPGAEHVYEVRRHDDEEQFPPLRSEQAPDRLPRARTSFVGRASAVNELCELLKREHMVTLVGTGGAGKTRLAVHVAALAQSNFADGAYWIDLTATDDPDRVPALVAESLGVPALTGRRAEHELSAYLSARAALIVVDNCEHVLDAAAALLDELLRACPNLVVFATSREPLRISGEHVWTVPPLAVGDAVSGERGDAVQLFLDRAELVSATVADADIPQVAEVCQHLDGIPLAIELAAARMRHLTPAQILTRLSDRFALLHGGGRDSDERHRTLRATLDWSHDLLDERERILFRRLAVFAADVELEAVEGICDGNGLDRADVLDVLSSLVDRSLVAMREGRYMMLETIREYAAEQLTAAQEVDDVYAHLCGWCLDRTREHFRPDERDTFISPEHPVFREASMLANLRVAIEWGFTHDQPAAHAIVAHTWLHFSYSGYWTDLALWVDAIGDDLDDLKPKEQGSIMAARAHMCMMRGEMARAFDLAQEAIDFAQREQLSALLTRTLVSQGVTAQASRRSDPEALFARALQAADAQHDALARGDTLMQLGEYILHLGRWSEADDMLAEARLLANDGDRVWAYMSGSAVALMLGDVQRALQLGADAVALTPEGVWGEYARLVYAMSAAASGDEREARSSVERALTAILRYRTPLVLGDALVFAAGVAHLSGDNVQAATVLGAARAEFGRTNSWRRPLGGAMYVYFMPRTRQALEPDVYDRARNQGLAMSADEAVAFALGPGD